METMTTEEKLKDCLACEEKASARVVALEDEMAAWVRKLNKIAAKIDEIWDGTHPEVAMVLTADLWKQYKALAASIREVPNAELSGERRRRAAPT